MKKITSLSLGISFIIMTYTGIMLFICPHGRVAYWSNWHLFGLSKDQYGELHTTSMIVFVLFGMLHIFYNWKPILSYLEDKRKKVTFTSKELFIALILNFVFIAGTLGMIQPFSGFLNFEESLKELKEEFASLFDKVVGLGMMRGLRCKSGVDLGMIIQKASKEGVLVLKAGRNTLRFLPPLTISKEEINEGFERLKNAIKTMA